MVSDEKMVRFQQPGEMYHFLDSRLEAESDECAMVLKKKMLRFQQPSEM